MRLRRLVPAATCLVLAGLGLGCAHPTPASEGDMAATSACRQRADEIYAKQNRAELYNSDTFATSGRDSPYATGTVADLPDRGLPGEYQRDNLVSDCLAGTGAASPAPAAPRPTPPPAGSAPPPPPS